MSQVTSTARKSPSVAVDGVVLCCHEASRWRSHWHVLLIRRGREPYRDMWAFPGGFVDLGEDLPTAVQRELAEETGLTGLQLTQFATYGDPRRDPRGHTISVVFISELEKCMPDIEGGDDAVEARWFSLDALPELAFDHQSILDDIMATRRTNL
jgi:8-oxo-dGTP diphosphatase